MKTFLAGTDVSLPIDFKVDGDLKAPDADSLLVWVYGQDGTPIAGWEASGVSVDGTQTSVAIGIAAIDNETATEGTIEKRTVVCVFQVNGATHQVRDTYLLTPFLNFSASPADVMHYFGLREGELDQSGIDMISAYLEAASIVTKETLDADLADTDEMFRANRLITLLAARKAVPSLRFAVSQLAKSDRTQFERYKTMDWADLESRLNAEIETATNVDTDVSSSIIVKSTPTDVITGV